MLQVCAAISDAGGTCNEDVVGSQGDWAWVIDGATGVSDARIDGISDAAWFARQIDASLRAVADRSATKSMVDVLRAVIQDCRQALEQQWGRSERERHERPSASIALVRYRSARLELATLGDCRIVYRDRDGETRLFGLSRIPHFESRTLNAAKRILEETPEITPEELRVRLRPQLRANRRWMNVPGGYWVLSTDLEAAYYANTLVIHAEGTQAALCSDGFLRLVDLFARASLDDLVAIHDQETAAARLRELRAIESEDALCRNYLRLKSSDDASILIARSSGRHEAVDTQNH